MSDIVSQSNIGVYALLSRRASYPCWIKFGINKAELSCLSALSYYLSHRNKTIVSWLSFKRALTGNSKEQAKMEGYKQGLFRLKMLQAYEYKRKPGSLCVGITDLGFKVLQTYSDSFDTLRVNFIESVEARNEEHEYARVA